MKKFWGTDFGVIALAKNSAEEEIEITISREISGENLTGERYYWLPITKLVVEEKTKFGRVGIIFDRKNKAGSIFYNEITNKEFRYSQKSARAEKNIKFSEIKTQVLSEMANEGLSDSVEFRRIMRKYIKTAKNHNLDSIIFLEGIFAEKETIKIIKNLAGSQLKVFFLTDLNQKNADQNPAKKKFKIKTDEDYDFTKKRAEKILQKKLKTSDIEKLD